MNSLQETLEDVIAECDSQHEQAQGVGMTDTVVNIVEYAFMQGVKLATTTHTEQQEVDLEGDMEDMLEAKEGVN